MKWEHKLAKCTVKPHAIKHNKECFFSIVSFKMQCGILAVLFPKSKVLLNLCVLLIRFSVMKMGRK